MRVNLIAYTPDPEFVAAQAGMRCYSAEGNDALASAAMLNPGQFIKKVVGMGHTTIIEHASFTFAVEGVSRSLLAQITRHRLASFSVQSQRYVGETTNKHGGAHVAGECVFNYVIPERIKELGPEAEALFGQQMAQIQKWYDGWVDALGGGRDAFEDARFVLPNAAETKFIFTMNARELLHFFTLRCCERAQWEIRHLAENMLKQVKSIAPAIFDKAGPACLRGPCPEGKMSCGKMKEVRAKYEV